MKLKLETKLDYYIFLIVIIKIIFWFSVIGNLFISFLINTNNTRIDNYLLHLKEITEFIFIICMSILLIYYFNPFLPKQPIQKESSSLFFLFGCILIITSKWNLILKYF